MRVKLKELAESLGAKLHGDGSVEITGISGIREAKPGDLTFLAHPKYDPYLLTTQASAVIMASVRGGSRLPVLECSDPYAAFQKALALFGAARPAVSPGIHPTAVLGPGGQVGRDVSIGAYVVVGERVRLGDRVAILPGCVIASDVEIGDDCFLFPRVVVREGTVLGKRVMIHSGAVIGDDGFGFKRVGDVITKIPQVGNVEIEDDVEVGANATIDRATAGTTRIGRGTRIDNLVMIAHNVQIGEQTILCAQVGISGSTVVGSHVTMAGQVGLVGHIEIGDRVQVGAQGGVTKSVPDGTSVSGYPAMPHQQARKIYASMRLLPDLIRTVRSLARRVGELEGRGRARGQGGDGA
jgi:UDP-3-O-[3-hydroxymyristoyl] glucosamine N-acyltransferase